jgi:hypothetical protein
VRNKILNEDIMGLGLRMTCNQGGQENVWAPGQKEPPPPILQIMILKLSPPRCVISKESAQQNELWFRKQLSTCLFVWTLNYKLMVPRAPPRLTPLSVGLPVIHRPQVGVGNAQHLRLASKGEPTHSLSRLQSDVKDLNHSTTLRYWTILNLVKNLNQCD